ncbi:hypothetical protein MLU30_22270 [Escherichia coli]|nr:hypothetical protein [Escherichia coli]
MPGAHVAKGGGTTPRLLTSHEDDEATTKGADSAEVRASQAQDVVTVSHFSIQIF